MLVFNHPSEHMQDAAESTASAEVARLQEHINQLMSQLTAASEEVSNQTARAVGLEAALRDDRDAAAQREAAVVKERWASGATQCPCAVTRPLVVLACMQRPPVAQATSLVLYQIIHHARYPLLCTS